jgi:hypothetical protein
LREPGLDGKRDAIGHELQQLDVLIAESASRKRADVQYSEYRPAHEQGHPDDGVDTGLPQDRIHHRGGVDAVEEQGAFLRSDAPSESLTERHAHALPHLILEAFGGGGDEQLP